MARVLALAFVCFLLRALPAGAAIDGSGAASPSNGRRSPHVPQNRSPARYSAPHAEHFMLVPSPTQSAPDDAPFISLYDIWTGVAQYEESHRFIKSAAPW